MRKTVVYQVVESDEITDPNVNPWAQSKSLREIRKELLRSQKVMKDTSLEGMMSIRKITLEAIK